MVLYKQSNRLSHGCLDFFNLRRPHDAHFRRLNHQHRRDYVVRQNAVRALEMWSLSQMQFLFRREFLLHFVQAERNSWRQSCMRISGQRAEPHTLNDKVSQVFSHFQFVETSFDVSKQIDDDQRFDQEIFRKSCKNQ